MNPFLLKQMADNAAAVGLIRAALSAELSGHPDAVLWPHDAAEIPDDSMLFRIAYLGPEYAGLDPDDERRRLDDLLRFCGQTRRQYRNAVVFVLPNAESWSDIFAEAEAEVSGRGADWAERIVTGEGSVARQPPDAFFESLCRKVSNAYGAIAVPTKSSGYGNRTEFERVDAPDDIKNPELHARIMDGLGNHLLSDLEPGRLAQLLHLGEIDCADIHRVLFPLSEVARWFFCFLSFPRVSSVEVIRNSVIAGIRSGRFGLLRERALLELDTLHPQLSRRVILGADLRPDQIDFSIDGGYLVSPDFADPDPGSSRPTAASRQFPSTHSGFVLLDGLGRSGTSLLARLVARLLEPHGFAYYYEPFQHPTPAGTCPNWREMIGRVLRPGDDDPELSEYLDRLRQTPTRSNLFWKEIRLALKQDWLLARYPDLRIIHLTRDILGVWSSHRRPGAPDWMAGHRRIWCEAARAWGSQRDRLVAKRAPCLSLLDTLPRLESELEIFTLLWSLSESFAWSLQDDRLLCVKYEDLCLNPIKSLTSIAGFLGVNLPPDYAEWALQHIAASDEDRDPSGRGTGLPGDTMPGIWRDRLDDTEIRSILRIAGAARESLGYKSDIEPTD